MPEYEPPQIFGDEPEEDGDVDVSSLESETHRGAFGEFGGESSGFIERTFRERIILVGVTTEGNDPDDTEGSLDELALLVDTAGADAVSRLHQRRRAPDPATFVGRGKAEEIRDEAERIDCDTVVFDDELTPAQQYNLERILGRSALDRTAVILDIFAQNASSQEGKAQVELAQLRYRLPRLRSVGRTFSQQGGGIGTRGPGETQLEVDRRRLVRRIHKLESELRQVQSHRQTQSKQRSRTRNREVALVGYTNAGKSSLLNRLTQAEVLVEDRLFATLDATTRRMPLPGGEVVFATDTVGFVRKLPHQLVTAFATTLDVVRNADLLVHVVDGSGPDPIGSMAAVRTVLDEIGAADIPELLVFNKADRSEDAARLADKFEGAVAVSAHDGTNLDRLLGVIGDRVRSMTELAEVMIPWDRGDVIASVHREGQVLAERSDNEGMWMKVRLEPASLGALRAYLVGASAAEANSLGTEEDW